MIEGDRDFGLYMGVLMAHPLTKPALTPEKAETSSRREGSPQGYKWRRTSVAGSWRRFSHGSMHFLLGSFKSCVQWSEEGKDSWKV